MRLSCYSWKHQTDLKCWKRITAWWIVWCLDSSKIKICPILMMPSTCDVRALMKPREMGVKWFFAKFEEIITLLSPAKWTGYFDGRATRRRTMWVHMETYELLTSHGIYIWLCKPCAAIKVPKESGWSFTMSHSHLFLNETTINYRINA